jgi:hypothetical protein
MKRKYTPLHNFWHPRIEGQIRDVIHHHPEWFTFKDKEAMKWCINSLAKRIVGEIVAGLETGHIPSVDVCVMSKDGGRKGAATCLSTEGGVSPKCAPSEPEPREAVA